MLVLTLPVLGAMAFAYFSLGRAPKNRLKAQLRRLKPFRLRQLLKIAKDVLSDTNEALDLIHNPATHPELRALIPIVSEVRKQVTRALSKSPATNRQIWNAAVCEELNRVLKELKEAEDLLRSIPKTKLTLEQVLAGHFETSEPIKTTDTRQI